MKVWVVLIYVCSNICFGFECIRSNQYILYYYFIYVYVYTVINKTMCEHNKAKIDAPSLLVF